MKDNSTGVEPGTRLDISSNMANDGAGGSPADPPPALPTKNAKRKTQRWGCLVVFLVLALGLWLGPSELLVLASLAIVILILWTRNLAISLWRLFTRPGRVARKNAREAAHPRRAYWRAWWREAIPRGLLVGVLLSPALACVLFLPRFVTEAQYAAEPIPVIGNLRTMVGIYMYEINRLPGLGLNSDETVAATSQLGARLSRVQTFSGMEPAAWAADFGSVIVVTNGNHVVRELDVSAYDMMGAKSRPAHYQYRGEMREGTNYVYVVGAFGDGDGLKAGTGYAVIELVNVDAGVKAVGTWERYKPVSDPKQIVMVNAEEARKYFKCDSPEQAQRMTICWVGDTDALMSGDKARVEQAVEELKQAGWAF